MGDLHKHEITREQSEQGTVRCWNSAKTLAKRMFILLQDLRMQADTFEKCTGSNLEKVTQKGCILEAINNS